MVLGLFATCLLSAGSMSDEVFDEPDTEYSPLEFPYDYRFVRKQSLGDIYDAYLFWSPQNMYYTAWLCSKDKEEIMGWQLLEFKMAKKIFPYLRGKEDQYAPISSS